LTVGQILDGGGKKLSKDEVLKLVSGAYMSGTQGGRFPNITFRNLYAPNGSADGEAWNKGVPYGKVTGTWLVNDQGQFCPDLTNARGHKVTSPCAYYFSIGDRYYTSVTDDRTAFAIERKFSR